VGERVGTQGIVHVCSLCACACVWVQTRPPNIHATRVLVPVPSSPYRSGSQRPQARPTLAVFDTIARAPRRVQLMACARGGGGVVCGGEGLATGWCGRSTAGRRTRCWHHN
jgi:hypothetical protein